MFKIIPHRALVEPVASIATIEESDAESTATLQVDGLLCSLCAINVTGRLEAVAGVSYANVDLESGRAVVRYDTANAEPSDLIAAVESAVILRPLRKLLARFGEHQA